MSRILARGSIPKFFNKTSTFQNFQNLQKSQNSQFLNSSFHNPTLLYRPQYQIFTTQKRHINWSHFSPRSRAQQLRFKAEKRPRGHKERSVEHALQKQSVYQFEEEKELEYANTWMDGRYGVNTLTLHQKTKLPTNYLNDFPDC